MQMRRYLVLLCAAVLALAGLTLSVPTTASADSTTVAAFDAYTKEFNTAFNGGTSTTLLLSNNSGFRKYAYVQVAVPALPAGEALDSAALRVFVQGTIPAGANLNADTVANNWTETGVTYANAPAVTTTGAQNVTAVAGWNSIPVTVTPGTTMSFRVRTTLVSTTDITLSSDEGANAPAVLLDTHVIPPPSWPPATTPITPKTMGMTASTGAEWDARLADVGRCGVEARRVYVPDLSNDWAGKVSFIQSIVADGMTPVISFKEDPTQIVNGTHDALLNSVRTTLNNLSAPVVLSYWHEPSGDITASQFVSASQHVYSIVDSPDIAVGPIMNGWLLDNQVSLFASFVQPLLPDVEFVGVDSYQAGTQASPDASKNAGRAVPQVATWLDSVGYPDLPIVAGEWNGYTAASITWAGNAFFNTPELWMAVMWNQTGGVGVTLTGDRLTAFKAILADSRTKHEEGC